jgi:hypothetical protein
MTSPAGVVGCTIVARNYIPYARVLADGWRHHHGALPFHVLVIDEEDPAAHADGFQVLSPAELGVDAAELARLRGIYGVAELTTALKPYLLRQVLDAAGDAVIFLDSDTDVHAGLHEVAPIAAHHGIVLSAHFLEPPPLDGKCPSELDKLRSGVFNSGFLAVGQSARPFLEWWASRLRRDCLFSDPIGLHADQGWLNMVPSYFEHHVLRDPGVNVAPWNIHERRIGWDDGSFSVNGEPLRTFHFAGFDPTHPQRPDTYEWPFRRFHEPLPGRPTPLRVDMTTEPGLEHLCRTYCEKLFAAGYEEYREVRYRFTATAAGRTLGPWERRAYRELLLAAEARGREIPDPFNAARSSEFERMLDAPGKTGLLSGEALARLTDLRLARPVTGDRWRTLRAALGLCRQLSRRAPGRRYPWTPHPLPGDRTRLEYAIDGNPPAPTDPRAPSDATRDALPDRRERSAPTSPTLRP